MVFNMKIIKEAGFKKTKQINNEVVCYKIYIYVNIYIFFFFYVIH